MLDSPKPKLNYSAGVRYLAGWTLGAAIGMTFASIKLRGLWSNEFVMYWLALVLTPAVVWLFAHIDRMRHSNREGLAVTFFVVGTLSWLPAFALLYTFRLLVK